MIKIGKKKTLVQKGVSGECPPHDAVAMVERLNVKISFEQKRCKREEAGLDVRRKINSRASIMLIPFFCKRCGEINFCQGGAYGLEGEDLVVAFEMASQIMAERMKVVAKKFSNIKDKRKLVKHCLQPIFLEAKLSGKIMRGRPKGYIFKMKEGD